MKEIVVVGSILLSSLVQAQQAAPRLGTFYSLGQINDSTYTADGSLIVGGLFERVGTSTIRNLARYAPDGTLDASWTPNPDAFIRAVVVDASGRLYVSGNYKNIAGVARPGLVRFNPGNPYTLDPNYLPPIPVTATSVDNLALRSDGTLYVSYCLSSAPAACKVARVDAQGNFISAFDVSANGSIFPLALSADEQFLLVAGAMTSIAGVTIPSRGSLAKLDSVTGAMDPSWIPFPSGNGNVRGILTDGTAHVIVAGAIPGGTEGFARIPLANPGTADLGFGPDFGPATNVTGSELMRAPDGDLVVAGSFTEADGQSRPARIARLSPDGNTVRAGWGVNAPIGGASTHTATMSATGKVALPRFTRPGLPRTTLFEISNADGSDLGVLTSNTFSSRGSFSRLVREPVSGRVFAAGSNLEEIDGRNSNGVFAFLPNLQPDLSWTSTLLTQATIGGSIAVSTGSTVMALGGFGFGPDGQQTRGLYRLSAVDGSASNWVPQVATGIGLSTNSVTGVVVDEVGGFVYALGVTRDVNNQLIPGGPFLRFAISNGLRDTTWIPTITLTGAPSMSLSGGFIYVGGITSTLATDNSTVAGLARFSTAGTGRADPSFKPFAASTQLPALAEDANFLYVGGPSTLARISKTSGLIDASWQPLLNPNGVNSLSVGSDGSVFLTGNLNAGCGGAIVPVARVHPGGNIDPAWRMSIDGTALVSLPVAPADLLIGGVFSRANNNAHDGLVRVGPSDGLFSDGSGDPRCSAPAS